MNENRVFGGIVINSITWVIPYHICGDAPLLTFTKLYAVQLANFIIYELNLNKVDFSFIYF